MATNDPTSGMPPFINRKLSINEWLSYVAAYDFGPIAPTRVVLHHTYIPNVEQWRGLASMQGMQRFYGAKGWTAGPHIYVAPDGIWLATPMKDIGIHAGIGNSGTSGGKLWYSIGCEMVGYYDKVRPSGAVWEGTKAVLGGLAKRLGIGPRQLISFHRDYTNQKSCPGWAVTKDWVWPEIEAWMGGNQAAPPQPPPPVQVGTPTPENETLLDLLMNESFQRRGDGYNADLAFNQYAVQNAMGFPIGKVATLSDGGKTYSYQPFARDTLYCEVPRWGEVGKLSDLLGGSIPPAGLGRALLDATYRASGATFHADWAFHQYAVAGKLGPPLAESAKLKVGNTEYAYQIYALDTVYNKIPDWQAIHRVSELASATDAASAQLRDALLSATYQKAGVAYHADWAFHQIARKLNLGAPLSDSYRVTSGATQYAIQVYATDTLYNIIPKWQEVRRALPLASGGSGVVALSAGGTPPAAKPRGTADAHANPTEGGVAVVLGPNTVFEPAPAPFYILRFPVPFAAASGTRSGARVRVLVLHSSTGSADEDLRAMAAPDAESMSHYYITSEGQIYQLADDGCATFHAGMANWKGKRQNLNRISLGITVQRSTKGYTDTSKKALAWLVRALRERYNLSDVVRWGDLDASSRADGADLTW